MAFRLPPQPKQSTREGETNQEATDQIQRDLRNLKILDGVFVGPFNVAAGSPKKILHKLKRQPKGWFVVDMPAPAILFRTGWNKTDITIDSSVNVASVKLWLF